MEARPFSSWCSRVRRRPGLAIAGAGAGRHRLAASTARTTPRAALRRTADSQFGRTGDDMERRRKHALAMSRIHVTEQRLRLEPGTQGARRPRHRRSTAATRASENQASVTRRIAPADRDGGPTGRAESDRARFGLHLRGARVNAAGDRWKRNRHRPPAATHRTPNPSVCRASHARSKERRSR